MKRFIFILFLFLSVNLIVSQKQPYIPPFLLDINNINGSQFSWDKTYESDNFVVIWGNSVGLDPLNSNDPNLSFNPAQVVSYLENTYTNFKNLGFLIDEPNSLKLGQYKVPVLMNNTWGNDPNAVTGWAYASTDGYMSLMFLHPQATSGPETLTHEFAHAIQFMVNLDNHAVNNPNNAAFNNNAGIFFETHAEFMTSQIYPYISEIRGMDVYPMIMYGDWKNTYRNYPLLYHLQLEYGIDFVNQLWFDQFEHEYPMHTIKRILNLSQYEFNNEMYNYVKRMPTLEYGLWSNYLIDNRNNTTINKDFIAIQNRFTILKRDDIISEIYRVSIEQAPEEYGYNIIPLFFDSNVSCINIKFKGHIIHNNSGWRYGIVEKKNNGDTTYGQLYTDDEMEFAYELNNDTEEIYLVIMGAPYSYIQQDDQHNTWTGYPKHQKYPYELTIVNALPEGYQNKMDFRTFLKDAPGNYHTNGGGWVDATATVGPEVYIASHAMVLGNSQISGTNTRVEGTCVVKDVVIQNNVHVKDNSVVVGGNYSSNGLVELKGNAYSFNNNVSENAKIIERANVSNYTLNGDIVVGGDVMVYSFNSCNNGTYKVLTNYYANNPLPCDGRDLNHPSNVDVNLSFTPFMNSQMNFSGNLPCQTLSNPSHVNEDFIKVLRNPVENNLIIQSTISQFDEVAIYDVFGKIVKIVKNTNNIIDVSVLNTGIYLVKITKENKIVTLKFIKK